jgi:hypothetical protein
MRYLEKAVGNHSGASQPRPGRIHCYRCKRALAANLEECLTIPSWVPSQGPGGEKHEWSGLRII